MKTDVINSVNLTQSHEQYDNDTITRSLRINPRFRYVDLITRVYGRRFNLRSRRQH